MPLIPISNSPEMSPALLRLNQEASMKHIIPSLTYREK